ncbi:MAG: sulfur carrier protein ThiS [Candidatus Eremiobacteraeota bacterium]|nr:sulfur carrier protein ThiS [Candidatus Eremiobacteraeota bacterium]
MMRATINGTEHELRDGLTLAELLHELGIEESGSAVAVNERVVRRPLHEATKINDGDAIEIIHAVAGG